MKLEGKVGLVTGSSQGIRQAIAVRLAQEGADIVIDYPSHPEGAQETLAKVEATGRAGFTVKADLGVVSEVSQSIELHEELPFPHFTSYSASKGGVKMMTPNLAIELGPYGVTINSIAPGAITFLLVRLKP